MRFIYICVRVRVRVCESLTPNPIRPLCVHKLLLVLFRVSRASWGLVLGLVAQSLTLSTVKMLPGRGFLQLPENTSPSGNVPEQQET